MQRDKDKLIELRKKMKRKHPKFRRVESWRYKRVKDSWRKARGIDSQTRKKTKSGVRSPGIGYRTPKAIRGIHPSGFEEVNVNQISQLAELNPKIHAIKIASRLGARKRVKLIEVAQQKNFKILNLGISQQEFEDLEAMLDSSIDELEDDLFDDDELDLDDLEDELLDED